MNAVLDARLDKIRRDFLVELIPFDDLFRKHCAQFKGKMTEGSFRIWLKGRGLTAARKKIKKFRLTAMPTGWKARQIREGVKKKAVATIKAEAKRAASMEAANEHISLARDGARRHFQRMAQMHDRVYGVLSAVSPDKKQLSRHLGHLDRFDVIGRRLYGMDDEREALKSGQLNVAILVGLASGEVPLARDVSP